MVPGFADALSKDRQESLLSIPFQSAFATPLMLTVLAEKIKMPSALAKT
jgi:hypothetical protein